MTNLPADGPNSEQISYWNEQSGPKWVAAQEQLDEQISGLGQATMDRAAFVAGERVLDVGCGCGQTSLQIAERVGSSGAVLGIDISTVMLERARQRAQEAGSRQIRFQNADAQTFALEAGSFDVAFSRFGVMFFSDPPTAFANLRRALAPDGRLAFLCWQEIQKNPWVLVPLAAAAQHVEIPPPPPLGTPGPFSLADPERVRSILDAAGFADIALEAFETQVSVGGRSSLDETVEFLLDIGPTSRVVQEAGEEARAAVAQSIREAIAPHAGSDGVQLGAATWIVTARRPAV